MGSIATAARGAAMLARLFAPIIVLLAASPLLAQDVKDLRTAKEKVSYGFGLNVGRSMLRDGLVKEDLDFELLVQGLRDALNEKPLPLTEEEFSESFNALIAPKLGERWQKRNETFLARNKSEKGVKTTASGLQYRVLKQGTGKTPKAADKVRVAYKGSFIDGTVFDQSEQPIEFPVGRVIKGWTEALQLMKEGDKWELFIPSDLAYSEKGFTPPGSDVPTIPPNSTLVFEVELLEVVPGTSTPAPAPKR
jgi:FKBP-type peptidyl-prolyl cis-trans isomerase FklB